MSAAGRKATTLVIVSLFSFALALMVHLSGILDPVELTAYDLFTRHLNPERGSEAGGNGLRPLGVAPLIVVLILVSVMGSVSTVARYAPLRTAAFALMLGVLVMGLSALLFSGGVYLHIAAPLAGVAISSAVAGFHGYLTEGRERLFIKRAFSRRMDSEQVACLMRNPSLLGPGGTRRTVTVLYAEISLAPAASAEKMEEELRKARNALAAITVRNSGVVDRDEGGLFSAFWGAPLSRLHDEENACRAALQCGEALKEMNGLLEAEGRQPLSFRIALHSGEALVGNPAKDVLFDYTVYGDAADTVARLVPLSALFGTACIVTEETLRKAGDVFLARELGLVRVQGRAAPLRVFELVGERSAVSDEQRAAIADFERALALFRELKWHAAARLFQTILKRLPADSPSRFYKERCEYLIGHPKLQEGWDIIVLSKAS